MASEFQKTSLELLISGGGGHVCVKRLSLEKAYFFNEMLYFNLKEESKLMWLTSWMVQFLPYFEQISVFHFKDKFYFIYISFKDSDLPFRWTEYLFTSRFYWGFFFEFESQKLAQPILQRETPLLFEIFYPILNFCKKNDCTEFD